MVNIQRLAIKSTLISTWRVYPQEKIDTFINSYPKKDRHLHHLHHLFDPIKIVINLSFLSIFMGAHPPNPES